MVYCAVWYIVIYDKVTVWYMVRYMVWYMLLYCKWYGMVYCRAWYMVPYGKCYGMVYGTVNVFVYVNVL